MSLLLDENLSPRLIPRLTSLFPGLIHVRDVDLRKADDKTIWDWARQNSYTVVTADSDFVAMVSETGPPPKLVQIERCDFPLPVIVRVARNSAKTKLVEVEQRAGTGLRLLRRASP